MNKKLVMQETYNGRVQTLEKFNEARYKLRLLNCSQLSEITKSQERDIETLLNGDAFWDGLTEARIAIEQEKYLDVEKKVDKIVELIDGLCTYIDVMAE